MAAIKPDQDYRRLVVQLENDLGMSAAEFAGSVGVSRGTVERWQGDAPPKGDALTRLNALVQTRSRLDETFTTAEAAHSWLHRPNEYLNGALPIDAIRAGRPHQVDDALGVIIAGVSL